MLESFQHPELPSDARRRLGASLVGSAVLYGVLGGAVVLATAAVGGASTDTDELIHVELATEPEAAPEPPAPPPEPVAEKAPRPRRRLTVPTKLADGPLAESDAPLPEEAAAPDEEPEVAVEEAPAPPAPAPTEAPVAEAPAPRPRAPRPAGPIQLPENATPPAPDPGNRPPAYPEAARSTGVEATVIAKIVVTESGAVGSIEILRGHPAFDDAVRAALRTWRFTAAMVDGRPTAVYRIIRVPFRLNNL